jgi:hypothetical protein
MCEFCHKHGEGKKWYLRADFESIEKLDRPPPAVPAGAGLW